jgi:hypothetical protein
VIVSTPKSQSCGLSLINFAETVVGSSQYSPLFAENFTDFDRNGRTPAVLGYTGSSHKPATPFNGPSGNPHLVVSVNGSAMNWNSYNFTPLSCFNYPNATCTGSIQIDPTGYLVAADIYDPNGVMMGTQANPFPLDAGLYADPYHMSNWATMATNGAQEWGTFVTPKTKFGVTRYMYVKQF